MFERRFLLKAFLVIILFFIVQLSILWYNAERLNEKKFSLEAQVQLLERKRDGLRNEVFKYEVNVDHLNSRLRYFKQSIRDILPSVAEKDLPTIYFVTPTYRRPTQKPDLIRLSQTLAHIPNLHWIVVEDSQHLSKTVRDLLERSGLLFTHLFVPTPANMKLRDSDPSWKRPRGVSQRNAALAWLRFNVAQTARGVVYFGDDDNVYDIRLFSEIRSVMKVGVWPVGIVGGLLVEAPIVKDGEVVSFNSVWKPERTFPFDMAAFAVNISLVIGSNAVFTYDVPRGYQETYFLKFLSVNNSILEPKANHCKEVLVWHTRTEKAKLSPSEQTKFYSNQLSELEVQAVG